MKFSKSTKISYLGMGIMGSAMAANLLKAGYKVTVWNRNPKRPVLAELASAGAVVSASLEDCVREAEVVFTCLGDENDVIDRLVGPNDSILTARSAQAASAASSNLVVVDFSTIGPSAAKTIAERSGEKGIIFLDAPVTGGDVGARNATLTIMVGGDKAAYQAVEPILAGLGKNVHHCGPAGAGQALKLCNQVLCAVNMIAVSEAMSLASDLAIEPSLVVDVLSTGAGGSWALTNLGKRILDNDLKPAFSIRNMLKDLRLVLESDASALEPSKATGRLPGTELSMRLFADAVAASVDLNPEALDTLGTQAMIEAYRQSHRQKLK